MSKATDNTTRIVSWATNHPGWHTASAIYAAIPMVSICAVLKQLAQDGRLERKKDDSQGTWRYRAPVPPETEVFKLLIGQPPKDIAKGRVMHLEDTRHTALGLRPAHAYSAACVEI